MARTTRVSPFDGYVLKRDGEHHAHATRITPVVRRWKRAQLRAHRHANHQRVARGLEPERHDRHWLD
jgi:hypothetical protein